MYRMMMRGTGSLLVRGIHEVIQIEVVMVVVVMVVVVVVVAVVVDVLTALA